MNCSSNSLWLTYTPREAIVFVAIICRALLTLHKHACRILLCRFEQQRGPGQQEPRAQCLPPGQLRGAGRWLPLSEGGRTRYHEELQHAEPHAALGHSKSQRSASCQCQLWHHVNRTACASGPGAVRAALQCTRRFHFQLENPGFHSDTAGFLLQAQSAGALLCGRERLEQGRRTCRRAAMCDTICLLADAGGEGFLCAGRAEGNLHGRAGSCTGVVCSRAGRNQQGKTGPVCWKPCWALLPGSAQSQRKVCLHGWRSLEWLAAAAAARVHSCGSHAEDWQHTPPAGAQRDGNTLSS